MSLLAISLAIKAVVEDPLAKFLLLLLADRHNSDTGECFPSLARLTEDSAMSRRTVIRKLDWLEEQNLITAHTRLRPDRGQASSAYTLMFVPEPADFNSGKKNPGRKRLSAPALPPLDWSPDEAAVARIKARYPHHDTSGRVVEYITNEWVDYCHAKGAKYVDFNAAWRASAERYLRRQSPGSTVTRLPARKRGRAGSLSGAIRRALED